MHRIVIHILHLPFYANHFTRNVSESNFKKSMLSYSFQLYIHQSLIYPAFILRMIAECQQSLDITFFDIAFLCCTGRNRIKVGQ